MMTARRKHPGNGRRSDTTRTVRIVDTPAGPPTQPEHDRAAHRLVAWQTGLADSAARLYDKFSFIPGIPPLFLREIRANLTARIRESQRKEKDDLELADDFTRDARKAKELADRALTDAAATRACAHEDLDHHHDVLCGIEGCDPAWLAPERLEESPRTALLWALVPVVGLLVEIPWSYYALQVLGETTFATLAMAIVFGWAGVLLAHLAGVMARHACAAGRRSWYGIAAACAICLIPVGIFLANVRFSALASPLVTAAGQTLPSGLSQFHLSHAAVFAGWIAVNIGLWVALGILSYLHTNPYVAGYRRAKLAAEATDAACDEAAALAVDAEAAVANALARRETCAGKWQDYRDELAAFTDELEAIYLRALATGMGNAEFTTNVEVNVGDAEQPGKRQSPAPGPRSVRSLDGTEPDEDAA
jgi:hypothetical protein